MIRRRPSAYFVGCMAALAYVTLRVALLHSRYFNVDEMEHLHAAWCMRQGLVIYRDFFEHHGPLWFLFLQWIPAFVHDPIDALWVGRACTMLFWAAIVAQQYRLSAGRWSLEWRWFSVVMLLSFSTFALHSIETRPDVPAALFILSAILALENRSGRSAIVWSGILVGTAFFCSPKIIFPVSGYLLGLALERRTNRHYSAVGWWILGAALPIAATSWYLVSIGAWTPFVHFFFIFNSHLHGGDYGWFYGLSRSLRENPIFWGLALCGLFLKDEPLRYRLSLGVSLVGLFFIRPIPFGQYFLLFSPGLAYFATATCRRALATSPASWTVAQRGLAIATAAGFLYSVYWQTVELRFGNAWQIAGIRCVMDQTRPTDQIVDTYFGPAFFRPHAYFYWWLCPDIPDTVGQQTIEAGLIDTLMKPTTRGLIWNGSYMSEHPALAAVAHAHYHAAGCGSLFLRND